MSFLLKGYNPNFRYNARTYNNLLRANCLNLKEIITEIIKGDYALLKEQVPTGVYGVWGTHYIRPYLAGHCKNLYEKYGKLDPRMTAAWLKSDMSHILNPVAPSPAAPNKPAKLPTYNYNFLRLQLHKMKRCPARVSRHYRYDEYVHLIKENCLNLKQIIYQIVKGNYALLEETPVRICPNFASWGDWGVGTELHIVREKAPELCKQLYAKYGKLDIKMTAAWLKKDMTL